MASPSKGKTSDDGCCSPSPKKEERKSSNVKSSSCSTTTSSKKSCSSTDKNVPTPVSESYSLDVGCQDEKTAFISISGMTCAACITRIESYLRQQKGISGKMSISLLTHKAEIHYDAAITTSEAVMDHIARLGFKPTPMMDSRASSVQFQVYSMEFPRVLEFANSIPGVYGAKSTEFAASNSDGLLNLLTIMYDPEKVGARELMKDLQAEFGSGCISVTTSQSTEDTHIVSLRQQLAQLKFEFILSVILTIPIALLHYVVPIFPSLYAAFQRAAVLGISWNDLVCFIFDTPIQLYVARPIYESGFSAMYYNGRPNMDFLIALSTSAAYGTSVYTLLSTAIYHSVSPINEAAVIATSGTPETFFEVSSLLVTFILLGRLVEQRAKSKTGDSILALLNLQVKTAILLEDQSSSSVPSESYIEIELVQRGDMLKILPGARVPTDGVVLSGSSKVDESMVTGESKLVTKNADSALIGGTINQSGVLIMKATRAINETMLAEIVRLVEEAQTSKPEAQGIADTVASYFSTFIITLSVFMFFVWYSFASTGVVDITSLHTTPFSFALRFCITILVISCPCAISLAVPTAVMVATGVGARIGVLVKGGTVFELLNKVDTIVFDKTGTLTEGKLNVVSLSLLPDTNTTSYSVKQRKKFWNLVGSLESNSEHQIGKAIVKHAKSLGCEFQECTDVVVEVGSGISCNVGSSHVIAGSLRWLGHNEIPVSSESSHIFETMQHDGSTVICVAVDGELSGLVALRDTLREEAKTVVHDCRERGLQVWMMTGDQPGTAKSIAKELDIPEYCVVAGVLPNMKVEKVGVLQSLGRTVAFVGDGINDSPAIAGSDVGCAVGAGTDVAMQTADLILVKSDLRDLINAMELSEVTAQRIRWNFYWGFLYNLFMMPIASGALYMSFKIAIPPELAGLSELFSSVPVIVLSLLLNYWQPPYTKDTPLLSQNDSKKRSSYGSVYNGEDSAIVAAMTGKGGCTNKNNSCSVEEKSPLLKN